MPDTYTLLDHIRYRVTRARGSIAKADRIIAISKSTAQDVTREFGRSATDIEVIHHGVSKNFSPVYNLADDDIRSHYGITKPYVLSLATLEPRKNLASLVEAFTILRERGHDIQLVLAGGPGWLRHDLDEAVRLSPYKDDIKMLGYIKDTARPGLLRGAVCLALPSRYEGFGMQILEAMACGTPVVTACNSSLSEIAGSAAVYARTMDVEELASAVQAIVQDRTLGLRLRARGLARAREFKWSDTTQRTLLILKRR